MVRVFNSAGVWINGKTQNFLPNIVFCLLTTETAFGSGGREAGPANLRGVLEYLEGEVRINKSEAEFGQVVEPGSTIETGPESFCEVVFQGKNIFQIKENSIVTINIDEVQSTIGIEQGSIAAAFNRLQYLGFGGKAFELNTATATAGVQGTAFFIKVEDSNNTYICTCNGQTSLNDAEGGNSIQVRAKHHGAYRFIRTGTTMKREKTGRLYHTDSTINRLARKIRVSINWGG